MEHPERQWSLIDRLNKAARREGWCLVVCGDGMIVIDTDHDSPKAKGDAFSYVESRADSGSLIHQIAHGLHGMILCDGD